MAELSPEFLDDMVRQWLSKKLSQAEKMQEKFFHLSKTASDDYVLNQLAYANNLVASIKWLRSQVPKSWSGKLLVNPFSVKMILGESSCDKHKAS